MPISGRAGLIFWVRLKPRVQALGGGCGQEGGKGGPCVGRVRVWRAAAIQGFALLQQQSANVRTRGFTPSGANVHEEFRLLRALPTFPSTG
jgi:hypothetical protein